MDKHDPPVDPYTYYPLILGQYSLFEVRDTVYSAGNKKPDTHIWQEKDEVSSMELDNDGIKTYIISRYTRSSDTDNWVKVKQYSVKQLPDKIIINLDNEIDVALIFPIDPNLRWEGYMYYNLDSSDNRYENIYRYKDINQPLHIDSISYEKTIKLVERNDTTGVATYNIAFKYYAAGVGLVLDDQTDYEYLQMNGEFIGYRTIGNGKRVVRKLIRRG